MENKRIGMVKTSNLITVLFFLADISEKQKNVIRIGPIRLVGKIDIMGTVAVFLRPFIYRF